MGAHHFHARSDAFRHFQAQAMNQLLIDIGADAFAGIDLVHHQKVAGIAQRFRIAAIPDRAEAHFRRHNEFGEFLGGFANVAMAHHLARAIVSGAP